MSALWSRVEISNDRWPHFMVLRALPEASCLMRLFAAARYGVRRHVAAFKVWTCPRTPKLRESLNGDRRLSLTQHFQQCERILRCSAFGIIVEVKVHGAIFF